MILMSSVTIAVIVGAVIVVAILVIGVTAARRRRRLQQRFGPEYDRLVPKRQQAQGRIRAHRTRTAGERAGHPAAHRASRAGYELQWAAIQEQFVDAPEDAVASSQLLVVAVMNELGYPAEDPDQMLADLSVEHAATLGHYRAAEQPARARPLARPRPRTCA